MGIQMVSIEKGKSEEMEGTSHGENLHHVITIMEEKINQPPRRLSENAGNEFCCSFRVPESFVGINKKAYQPHIVSIGPYHYGKDHLEMMQEHKWRFLGSFLRRTRRHNVDLVRLFRALEQMEERIRECYSEMIEIDKNSLVKMMVLDGCFIVELFCIVGGLSDTNIDDPIFNMQWILTFIMRDLLRLENQIPFFVLETLFKLSISGSDRKNVRSLTQLSLEFFNYMVQRPVEVIEYHADLIGKHLLDLFRMSFLPSSSQVTPRNRTTSSSGELSRNTSSTERTSTISPCLSEETSKMSTSSTEEPSTFLQLIPSAKKLHLAGIQFKPGKSDSFLDVKFNNGVLQIPLLTIDDFSSSVFLNCVAFEQCYHYITNHVTTYATFMGCLINTPSDAGFLCDHKIIENYFGTDEEIARFFNNIRKDVAFDIEKSYLSKLFEDVNEYYRNDWHVRWAGFKHTYFDTPWSFMSAMAFHVGHGCPYTLNINLDSSLLWYVSIHF
ncbi:UPF0481 protein At3g47200-like [Gossypium arboreum]|uniref:UPF0481 protein At3g47200-like n=1 Tax=Gossypium arboreum TaxID=29729 RepID=UPI0022F1C154|nr:UPF0481 protein At3g47200-like [Gossypium arboreum]